MRPLGRIELLPILFTENPAKKIDRERGRACRLRSDQVNRRKLDYVMQRPRMLASRGEEIGEKDPSHPTGIRRGFCAWSCLPRSRAPRSRVFGPFCGRLRDVTGAMLEAG